MSFFSKLQAQMPSLPPAPNLNIGAVGSAYRSTVQASRERFGNVSSDEITELPQEYKDLEARVDALKATHQALLKITKVYESESYDYPTQITESMADLGGSISHNFSLFAEKNLKGTNLPLPAAGPAPIVQPKTLPHALSRAAATGSVALQAGGNDRLSSALAKYSSAQGKIGDARLLQDDEISERFVRPWQATLTTSIAIAVKARAGVKQARLELDSARQILKAAGPAKQEQARLDVENAEDKLVQQTEIAIGQMKSVLDNPEPLLALAQLVKSQLVYFNTAAETLAAVQGQIEEAAVAAEGEYRQSRA